MDPVVTVIIPTHNRPDEVRRAVRSVLAQTREDWRLIVVDDGSDVPVTPDVTGTGDPRVTILRLDPAQGVSNARNAGLELADTPWVAFLDDDDLWAPGKLGLQLHRAELTGATLLYTAVMYVTPAGRWIYQRAPDPTDDLGAFLLTHNAVGEPSTVMVRRDLLQQTGGFDPEFSMLADWDLWMRLSEVATPCPITAFTTAILVHEGNMQVTDRDTAEAELALLAARHRDVTERVGRDVGSVFIDLWLAEKRFRASPSRSAALAYARQTLRAYGPVTAGIRATRRARHAVRPQPAAPWVQTLLRG